MNTRFVLSALLLLVLLNFCSVFAQEDVTIVAPTSKAAEGLDLRAVSDLFKNAENLEDFEKTLNDPETGVNNLDLDENGEVDYIRVVEEVEERTHVIILQVALGEDEFQDVATIEVESSGDDQCNMQIHGNEVIYGPDYYVAPTLVRIHTWPIITWMYRPMYRPYRSVYYYGYYPRWWRPYPHVSFGVYRTRTIRYSSTTTFKVSRTSHIKTVTKVNYKPRSSTLVKKKTTITKTPVKGRTTKKVTKVSPRGKTTVKAGAVKRTNKKTGNTTVKAGAKKTTKKGGKTTVKGKSKKTTKKAGKKTTAKAGKRTVKKKKG